MFISAAEAKWGFDGIFEGSPVGFLHDYLVAKRAAEDEVWLLLMLLLLLLLLCC